MRNEQDNAGKGKGTVKQNGNPRGTDFNMQQQPYRSKSLLTYIFWSLLRSWRCTLTLTMPYLLASRTERFLLTPHPNEWNNPTNHNNRSSYITGSTLKAETSWLCRRGSCLAFRLLIVITTVWLVVLLTHDLLATTTYNATRLENHVFHSKVFVPLILHVEDLYLWKLTGRHAEMLPAQAQLWSCEDQEYMSQGTQLKRNKRPKY